MIFHLSNQSRRHHQQNKPTLSLVMFLLIPVDLIIGLGGTMSMRILLADDSPLGAKGHELRKS
jgi:hypothetical protein